MASRIEPLLTVADLEACPDDNNRYELIGGELFVSRAPGLSHQRILLSLANALSEHLKDKPTGILVPGAGAVFSDYDAVIPDLAYVSKDRWDQVVTGEKFTGPPNLVIEILSPGTENRRRDLTVKRQLYAKYGVEEYWIVDSEDRQVLIYRLQGERLEEKIILTDKDEITSAVLPDFQLLVSAIFSL